MKDIIWRLMLPGFLFLAEFIDETDFLKDTRDYIYECKKYYEYKEKQRPIIEAQKEFEKKKRKFYRKSKCQKNLLLRNNFIIMINFVRDILLIKKMLKSYLS